MGKKIDNINTIVTIGSTFMGIITAIDDLLEKRRDKKEENDKDKKIKELEEKLKNAKP